jgi:hypothetical protein
MTMVGAAFKDVVVVVVVESVVVVVGVMNAGALVD